jgi:tagatose 1,6-diphosphate aldolase
VLCGRATWKDGIAIFAKQGKDAFRRWLETTGVENINNVNDGLKAASPWYLKYGAKSMNELG